MKCHAFLSCSDSKPSHRTVSQPSPTKPKLVIFDWSSGVISAPAFFALPSCVSKVTAARNSGANVLLTVSSIRLPHGPPSLIGQVTKGSSARSIQTSAPTAPASTTASVSTRSTPSTASAPQVRLPYRCRRGGGEVGWGSGRGRGLWGGGQGAQRSISLSLSLSLCALLAPCVSLEHKHTHTNTFGMGTNPSPEAGLRRPG